VLDAGCGAGTKSRYLAGKGLAVTGIDFSEKMIEIAQREVPDATFRVADFTDPATLTGTYDGIFMQAALLHVPRARASVCIAGLSQHLHTGGYFYVAVKGQRPGGAGEEVVTETDYGYTYERFFSFYTADEIRKYFADAGLKIVYESSAAKGGTSWLQAIGQKQ